jgi:hypothetical protein
MDNKGLAFPFHYFDEDFLSEKLQISVSYQNLGVLNPL